LTEGVSNLYFTNTRADARVTALFPNLFATALTGTTTDALAQGSTNKYYSDSLVSALLNTYNKGYFYSTTSAEAWFDTKGLGVIWSTSSSNYWLDGKTTDNLSEGSTNLYFTNARARQSFSTNATGLSYSSTTGVLSLTSGYIIPTTASTSNWDSKLEAGIFSALSTGTIPVWNGSAFTNNTALLTATSSTGDYNIGIGTTSTTTRLSVEGDIYSTGTVTAQSLNGNSAVFDNLTVNSQTNFMNGLDVVGNTNISGDVITTGIISALGQGTSYVLGSLGVGTTSPNYKLDVVGDINFTGNLYQNGVLSTVWSTSSSNYWLTSKTTTNLPEGTNLYFTNARARQAFSTDATGLTYSSTSGALSLTSGYVIPTTSDVANWNSAVGNTVSSVTGPLTFNSGNLAMNQANATTDGYLTATDWNTFNNKMGSSTVAGLQNNYTLTWTGTNFATSTIYDNGTNIGIGTTTPDKKLTVAGDVNITGNYYKNGVVISNSSLWSANGNNINYMSGNVGIGTTSPTTALSVVGDISFSGNMYKDGSIINVWTESSLNNWLATKSTTNLAEGTNLYFTNDRADARISASFANLFSTTLLSTTTNALSEGSNHLYYTDGRVSALLNTYDKGFFYSTTSADNWFTTKGAGTTQWTTSGNDIYYATGTVGIGSSGLALQALTVFGSTTATQKAGYFSTDNMLLASLEGGSYFGRTAIRENNFALNNYGNTWTATGPATTTWKAIAMSSNGKYQSAVVGTSGQIYISSDYGVTWSAKGSTLAWTAIAMSADGKIQTATVSTGNIYVSYDYGVTWASKGSSLAWVGIAMSADGKIQTAVVDGGQIYISINYGSTWIAKDSARSWRTVAMSSDGKIQTAVGISGNIYVSQNYGNTWTPKDSIRDWEGITISSDGKIQTAVVFWSGQIYISTDYGNTWTAKDSSRDWFSIAMSADGKIQTAVVYGGQIYISNDYGNTWTAKGSSQDWLSVAMSSDGKIMTAVSNNGQIYISHADTYLPGGNFGVGTSTPSAMFAVGGDSFLGGNITGTGVINLTGVGTSTFASALNVTANATSTFANGITIANGCFAINGSCLAVTSGGSIISSQWDNSGLNIYYNGGNVGVGGTTTAKQSLTVFGTTSVTSPKAGYFSTDNMLLASLEGGSYFGRTAIRENNFAVNNYGNSWTGNGITGNWLSIAVSSDGKIQTAVSFAGQIYISTDYGVTWTATGSTDNWRAVAMSSDGKNQTAISANISGNIYISSDYGNTWATKGPSLNWKSLAMSSDGKIQTVGTFGGQLYISSDFGNTWTSSGTTANWYGVAMSSDGKIQSAVANGGQIYVSVDYGTTWTARGSSFNWTSIAMSADGKNQTGVNNTGYIFVSSDYGTTWTQKGSSSAWNSVAMSSDGKIQTAVVNNGYVYVSTDYGSTWTQKGSSANWVSVAMSSDGKVISAAVSNGQIYVSHADTYLPSGNFGIGTTTPSAMFAVAGDAFLGGNITGTGVITLTGTGTSTLASALNITSTATSTFAGGISLSGGCFAVNGACLNNSQWTTSGTNIYYNTGNVGIGTTTPFAKLSVAGSAYIGGTITATGTLNITGAGTSTFASLINVTSNATSTFAGGINVTGGCLSVNGVCATTGSYVSSQWVSSGSNIYYNDGNVGIGASTNAGQALTVFGSLSSNQKAGYFSTDNMLLSSLEGGSYFGRTAIREKDFDLTNYGNTWVSKGTNRSYLDIAVSSDGKIQTAISTDNRIYRSADYGNNWSVIGPSDNWKSVSMSSDGKIQTALAGGNMGVGGNIYVSTDYGVNWVNKSNPYFWMDIAVSSDGKIQTAVSSNGYIYVSNDYGNTWSSKDSVRNWNSVAMSSDGKIQAATVEYGQIYISRDYGLTWNGIGSTIDWKNVSMSADGKKQIAETFSDIYVSNNYGSSWNVLVSNKGGEGIAVSSDAKLITTVNSLGYIQVSSNYGVSWSQKGSAASWSSVAMSSDGKIQVAVGNDIYVSHADTYLPGGNFGIGTSSTQYPITLASGAYVTAGGTWTNASSRDLKENFTEVNGDEILAKINQLNITEWNYKLESKDTVHIGPIAEEFYDLFKLGGTDKSISSIDPAGIALVGIQTLSKKVDALQKQLDDYKFGTSSAVSSAGFLMYLETLGAKITNGLAVFKEIAAEKITATVAMFSTVRVEEGIESKDKITGEYSCMIIENGEWKKVGGRCVDYNKVVTPVVENNSTPITEISTTTENILTETSTTTQNISTTTETTTGGGEVTSLTEPTPATETPVVITPEPVVETPPVNTSETPTEPTTEDPVSN